MTAISVNYCKMINMLRKLSPHERLELLQIYFSARMNKELSQEQELNVSAICKSRGISRNTFYRWKRRFEREGYSGLFDRRVGRKQLPKRTIIPEELVQRMIFFRKFLGLSFRQIAEALQRFLCVSHTTIRRILHMQGFPGRVYKRRKKKYIRFSAKKCDEIWQIDHSRSDFDGKWRLVILDDHSRMVLCCEEVSSLESSECCKLLLRTIKRFAGRKPQKLLSDNHRSFRSRVFKELLACLGIKAVHSSVHHPQTLGKVERFNRTFQENAWYFPSPRAYLRYYNFEKKHAALAGNTPGEVYFQKEGFKMRAKISSLGVTVTRLG